MAQTEASSTQQFRFETESLTGLHWAAMLLAAITGAIHLYLFTTEDWIPFLLAGLGFFGAIGLVLFNVYRHWLYAAGVLYTLSQIVGYFVFPFEISMTITVIDKAVQVLLILILVQLFRTSG